LPRASAVPLDHLDQPAEAADRALFLDQERRVDLAGGVVHGDDQVERRLVGEPGVLRAVLVQEHAAHRPPRPLAAMGAAPRRRRHPPGPLEIEPGGGVAELVAVALRQLLVEMLDGEALIVLLTQRPHALEFVLGLAPGRRPADPAIDQAVHRVVLVAFPPAAQGPFAHPMIPILASLSTRPNPHSKFLGTVPEPDRSRAP
jgi:hypothetical protein